MLAYTRRSAANWLPPIVAVAVYALMWVGYRQGWGWLIRVDSSTLRIGYDIGVKHPDWVGFWDLVCTVFAPTTFRLLGLVAVVAALTRSRVRTALFVLVSVELSGPLGETAKSLANRPRPVTAMVTLPPSASSSFPSGHALGALVGVVALLVVTLPVLNRRLQVAAVVVGAVIVTMVGLGRVALNVHHLSDVLAGWALGYAYVAVCARLLKPNPDRLDLDDRLARDTGPD